MTKIKRLYAIHRDAHGNVYRTKIDEGSTADFAKPIGFVVEDTEEHYEEHANGMVSGGRSPLGLNGTYPAMLDSPFSNMEGKLLTLCDATFTNKEQREAFKSVVRETIWNMFNNEIAITEASFHKSDPNWMIREYVDLDNLTEADIKRMGADPITLVK